MSVLGALHFEYAIVLRINLNELETIKEYHVATSNSILGVIFLHALFWLLFVNICAITFFIHILCGLWIECTFRTWFYSTIVHIAMYWTVQNDFIYLNHIVCSSSLQSVGN